MTAATIRVTDLALWVRPIDGQPFGEVWLETAEGPSTAWLWRAGDGVSFSSSHSAVWPGHPQQLRIRMVLAEHLASIPALRAPVLKRKPLPVWLQRAMPWARDMATYVCPICGDVHTQVTHAKDRPRKPPCGSLLGLSPDQVPGIIPGDPINTRAYERGTLVLRLSTLEAP